MNTTLEEVTNLVYDKLFDNPRSLPTDEVEHCMVGGTLIQFKYDGQWYRCKVELETDDNLLEEFPPDGYIECPFCYGWVDEDIRICQSCKEMI